MSSPRDDRFSYLNSLRRKSWLIIIIVFDITIFSHVIQRRHRVTRNNNIVDNVLSTLFDTSKVNNGAIELYRYNILHTFDYFGYN